MKSIVMAAWGAALLAGMAQAVSLASAQAVLLQKDGERPEASPMRRVPAMRAEAAKNGQQSDRVFGGNAADPGEWPFQVALLSSDYLDQSPESQAQSFFCGGSVISPEWVLTAAHCVYMDGRVVPPESITVLTGATELTEGTRVLAAEIIAHESYDESSVDNDIALIRLAKPTDAPAIKLPDAALPDTGAARVTGWGRMEDGTFPLGLMEAELKLEPNAACNAGLRDLYAKDLEVILRALAPRMRYSDTGIQQATQTIVGTMSDRLSPGMLCAGTTSGQRDACNGDSGGPLFVEDAQGALQVGIVSWGEGPMDAEAACGHANLYGVYTRVSTHREWIRQKTGL